MTDLGVLNAHAAGVSFLAGGGEMGERMRAFDWAPSPLGPPERWPQSLKTAIRIMLTSRQPIWVGWGDDLLFFYNDAYKPIIGGKHGWALGRPTSVVWAEIWGDIGPMLDTALSGIEGTYVESQLLIMERNGYPEETYYTFSYSPIPDDDGNAGGIICANTDDTQRVIGERQLALLRDLAASTADARNLRDACERAGGALGTNARDLPFALIYMTEPGGSTAKLAGCTGVGCDHPAAPVSLEVDTPSLWPFPDQIDGCTLVSDLSARITVPLPGGDWGRPPHQAVALPIPPAGETGRTGTLVVGLNPFRVFDDRYRRFLELVAGQVAGAVANALAYEEERRRVEALAELDRSKTAFFSNISHEFRTPLTLMLGPLEEALADAARLMPEELQRVQVAHRNGLRLLKLVNALLDFSRIEAGRAQASFEPADLAAVTAELASTFRSACERAGLDLVVDCPALTEPVYVDLDMWEKIVLNLLSNAFKFTFEGTIAVSVAASGGAAVLTVRDSGTGIPAHELPRLFERFHRVEGAPGRSYEGSGIGLALVQELVKLHGGSIGVESEEGRGTTFTVTIPLGSAHLPPDRIRRERSGSSTAVRAQAFVEEALRWLPHSAVETPEAVPDVVNGTTAPPPPGSGERPYVLLADDNADMRDYVCRLLGGRCEIAAVGDGEAALATIRDRRPDLLLTDIMMPRLDGFGLLRALRADPDLQDLPVIMLSARAGEEAGIEGRTAGADDYLVKPFSARELVARTEILLAMARLRREHTEALRRLNEALEDQVAERTRERDRVWSLSRDLFVVCGFDGRYRTVNPAWRNQLGYTEQDLSGLPFDALVHPDDRASARAAFDRMLGGAVVQDVDLRVRAKDGAHRWYSWTAVPEGAVFYAAGRDVTARKELEEQLRQAQKMEAVGKLTGGVAHDFNNLLQVIGGNLQLLTKEIVGNGRAEQQLRNALSGVTRGSKLASQLLAFGRRQPLAPKAVNLGRLIRNMDDMLRRALGEAVEIETVIAGGLWNTFVDAGQVENALLNLAINARDAMDGRGRLTIEAGNAALDDGYAARHAEVTPGQYVMLAVTDTGCGIPPELLERVFEPFFTTKPEGLGTGLGLSMVYGFVKQSDGHVKIYSEPGHGTTVRIYLPRTRQDEDVAADVETGPVVGGAETILVVEDDEDVRATVVAMLSDLGYRVLKAKDALSALVIVESGVPIDLLFTDVVMPGPLRSPELARKARERLPGIAILFTSGYTENAIVHGGRLDDDVELLSKPYSRERLARKLRHVLGNQRQRTTARRAGVPLPGDRSGDLPRAGEALHVLIVEDDELIRMCTADLLAGMGHTVHEAGKADEALAVLDAEAVDVLLTDISLPDTSGVELARRAIRQYDRLRVVFATGHDLPLEAKSDPALAGASYLRKPYDEHELAEVLKSTPRRA